MPVKKSKRKSKKEPARKMRRTFLDTLVPDAPMYNPPSPLHHISEHGRRIFLTLLGILLVYIIVWFATLIRNNLQEFYFIGQAGKMEHTISVNASQKIIAKPDVATLTIGMNSHGSSVAAAQAENTAVMNDLIEKLKDLGVEEDSIQTTNYNIYPRYKYDDGEQIADGYDVNQGIKVTCGDTKKASKIDQNFWLKNY